MNPSPSLALRPNSFRVGCQVIGSACAAAAASVGLVNNIRAFQRQRRVSLPTVPDRYQRKLAASERRLSQG